MREHDVPLSRGRVIPASAIEYRTARASGPGGQHVNKTETKVQLLLDPAALAFLTHDGRARLVRLAGRCVDADGRIYVICQDHRDLLRNVEAGRAKLAALVEAAMVVPKRRVATKPTRGSKERRLEAKSQRARTKAGRARVRDE